MKEAQQQLADMRRRMPQPHPPTDCSASGNLDTDSGGCGSRDGAACDLPTLQQLARATADLQVTGLLMNEAMVTCVIGDLLPQTLAACRRLHGQCVSLSDFCAV